jgi:hypothetical protein
MLEPSELTTHACDARAAAAEEIWATCTGWAQIEPTSVVLVHRGSDPLWPALESRMHAGGVDVRRIELADADQSWVPLQVVGESRADMLIHHDPFIGGDDLDADAALPDVQRELLTRFRRLVVVSFPHGLRDVATSEKLCARYLGALTFPHRALERRAHAVSALMERARSLTIVSERDERTWTVPAPFVCRSDWTTVHDGPAVLQLPLGEVWAELEHEHRTAGAGDVTVTTRDGLDVTVHAGSAHAPELGHLPLCEIGIGVNPAATALHATVLSEKADGTFHVGVGENVSLGGRTPGPDHRDLMVGDRGRLIVSPARGGWVLDVNGGRPPTAVLVRDALDVEHILPAEDLVRWQAGVADPSNVTVTRVPATPVPEHRDNVRALELLADPRLSEVVLVPFASAPLLGVLGTGAAGIGEEPQLVALLELLTELLGPLPWHSIEVVAARTEYADATSRPGVVTIDPRLVGRPHELRWLYLSHELVHQWIGGALRLGPRHARAWEDVVERLAHAAAVQVLGPASLEPFQRLRSRQVPVDPSAPDWTRWDRAELRRGLEQLRGAVAESLRGARRIEDLDPVTLRLPAGAPSKAGIA